MAASSKDSNDSIVDINMTPMVDILLVLLVIFMVSSTLVNNKSINVALPNAASASKLVPTELNFSINKDSKLFLDTKEITYSDLPGAIDKAKKDGKTVVAAISADKAAPYGEIIKLIDFVKTHGIDDFSIVTEGN